MTAYTTPSRLQNNHLGHWNLRSEPFHPVIHWPEQTQLIYHSRSWEESLARIQYLCENFFGLGVLIGPRGSGKSLLLKAAVDLIIKNEHTPHYHTCNETPDNKTYPLGYNQNNNTNNFIRCLINNFPTSFNSKPQVLLLDDIHKLKNNTFLLENMIDQVLKNEGSQSLVICIDETHVTNLHTLLHQFAPLIIRINPLEQWETAEYMQHRLQSSGASNPIFTDSASELIHQLTAGIPRQINRLAHECLLMGALKDKTEIDEQLVQRTYREFQTQLLENNLKNYSTKVA